MLTDFAEGSVARRRLILRDSLAILSLTLATVVLFLVTLFLFRSFSAHREVLAQRWSDRGRASLQAGNPGEAIEELRTALSYAPGTQSYELLLAQALGEAGRTDESYNYFMSLWEAEPGNGFINLQLARLAAKRNDHQAAVNSYRAAIYGTWEGDGVPRRAAVRIELARYLVAQHQLPAARLELLIAGGNAPDDHDRDIAIADLLQQTDDTADAWTFYQRAIAAQPGDPAALDAAGRLAFQSGDFDEAHRLLLQAQAARLAQNLPIYESPADVNMLEDAARILELTPSPNLPPRERVDHILAARAIARKRFDACSAQLASTTKSSALPDLSTLWSGPEATADAAALRHNPAQQDAAMQLVYNTEEQCQKLCAAATGDDALLLRLATTPRANLPAEAGKSAQTALPRD
jgi:Tfp pilus assembly protein PilF